MGEETSGNITLYVYDAKGTPVGFRYHASTYAEGVYDEYWFEKSVQGDILAVYDDEGKKMVGYSYDAWGKSSVTNYTGATTAAKNNPFTYRGYYYDKDLGLYYLNSRYYDAKVCRFVNADGQISTDDLFGCNIYSYCGNNPVNNVDPIGQDWWHWALGAVIVAACAVATVVTCGGFAAAATAVCMVGSGVAAATTASTIAAGAFIGASIAYGTAVAGATLSSSSIEEFNDKGNWGTVASTAFGAVAGGTIAHSYSNNSNSTAKDLSNTTQKNIRYVSNDVIGLPRAGSALKTDSYHAFPSIIDNYVGYATKTNISNGTLYQLQGSLNGVPGRFEWIIQNQQITHRMFVEGGGINGIPIMP